MPPNLQTNVEQRNAFSPYKFLNPYNFDDREIFFGRDREITVLVSDILVSRLVVLFAPTGTGKTSLINAGVRPQLEDDEYATFFIRVRNNPIDSTNIELRSHPKLARLRRGSFSARLTHVVEVLEKPAVFFFDQFEEFFIYTVRYTPQAAEQFISEVAELYEARKSKVHIVFSMREEFFLEMDRFRERIPSIFHTNSNLRLRWFDLPQAERAIVGPAAVYGVEFEPRLRERLLKDLAREDGRIEPATLQIVCDTLWRRGSNGRITLEDYLRLAPDPEMGLPQQILNLRLDEVFEGLQDRAQFDVLARVLPLLKTERNTKKLWDVEELVKATDTAQGLLDNVLDHLEHARVLQRTTRDDLTFVELTHDYLVELLPILERSVAGMWPRRTMNTAMHRYLHDRELAFAEEVAVIVDGQHTLRLSSSEAELVFRSALFRGVGGSGVFELAARAGVPVGSILEQKIASRSAVEAGFAIQLLPLLPGGEAEQLLERVLYRDEWPGLAAEALAETQTLRSVEILARALRERRLTPEVNRALANLAMSQEAAVARAAVQAELDLVERALDQSDLIPAAEDALWRLRISATLGIADTVDSPAISVLNRVAEHATLATSAAETLGRIETLPAVALLRRLAERDPLVQRVQMELERLARSVNRDVAEEATRALLDVCRQAIERDDGGVAAVESLARLQLLAAVPLLERALGKPTLRPRAAEALTALLQSRDPSVVAAARAVLEGHVAQASPRQAPIVPRPVPKELGSRPSAGIGPPYPVIRELLLEGRVVPLLGAGIHVTGRAGYAFGEPEQALPSAVELARYLAAAINAPDIETEPQLPRVAQYAAAVAGQQWLNERLHDAFNRDVPAGPVLAYLAQIASVRPIVIISTNYDDILERALRERDVPFHVIVHASREGEYSNSVLWWRAGAAEPTFVQPSRLDIDVSSATVIYKPYGGIDRHQGERDQFVITEDDYVELLVRVTNGSAIPAILAEPLQTRSFLILGYGLDWSARALLRSLFQFARHTNRQRSWAVQYRPTQLDVAWLRANGVNTYDMELAEFIEELGGLG